MTRLRYVAEELFDMLNAPFTYWLALLIAFMAWRMLPAPVAFFVVLVTLGLLALDECREWFELRRMKRLAQNIAGGLFVAAVMYSPLIAYLLRSS